MNKTQLLNLLVEQAKQPTTKTTRKAIIELVAKLVDKHINQNAIINGINATRNNKGVNLGEVVEVVIKSIFNNELTKDNKNYDLLDNGKKVEVKFTTSDAYSHPINPKQKVKYYLIVAYTQMLGGQIFKVPYNEKDNIKVNKQGRVVTNQLAKYLDRELTNKVFAWWRTPQRKKVILWLKK